MSRRRQQTAEPENCGPASGLSPAGLLRGTGDGTSGWPAAEQERPSLATRRGSRSDKAEPKRKGAKRESEGVVVPVKRGRTTSRREGPLLESSFLRR